jgi:non-ribosomal peptide synthetase component F
MAIEMAGAVYCPLPAHDPPARRLKMVQETGSSLVLVHFLTKDKCEGIATTLNIGSINLMEIGDVHRLSSVVVTHDNIAYISFTSGSTGVPKAVG